MNFNVHVLFKNVTEVKFYAFPFLVHLVKGPNSFDRNDVIMIDKSDIAFQTVIYDKHF